MSDATADPFAGGVEPPAGDPFADDFQSDDPFADKPEASVTAEPPLVNREGERIEPVAGTADAPSPEATNESEDEAKAREADAAAEDAAAEFGREVPSEAPSEPESTSSGEPGAEAGSEDPTSASGEQTPAEAGSTTTASTTEGVTTPLAQKEAALAEASGSLAERVGEGRDDGEGAPGTASAESEEPPERENEIKDGKVVKRAYKLLAPDGGGKWREVSWYEDKDGKLVEKGTEGARKHSTCVVHGTEAALRIGWRAMGAPQDGCKLIAVSVSNFKVRHVGPEAKPERQKLVIK